ncbi:hypothetical protein FBU30_008340 [Linnemannia zychae]|nr:hypothetical protein FBU30_008340 [Linnemannia zychae]
MMIIQVFSGEKILESSRIMRQQQSSEFGDVSESERKVDKLFMFHEVEISNVEFKKPGTTKRELTIQYRKNIQLTRCIQEAHTRLIATDPIELVVDVSSGSHRGGGIESMVSHQGQQQ